MTAQHAFLDPQFMLKFVGLHGELSDSSTLRSSSSQRGPEKDSQSKVQYLTGPKGRKQSYQQLQHIMSMPVISGKKLLIGQTCPFTENMNQDAKPFSARLAHSHEPKDEN